MRKTNYNFNLNFTGEMMDSGRKDQFKDENSEKKEKI
jgi:hypothetical protein